MRHLLMLTPALDEADPVLGFAIGWVNALAERVPRMTAIVLRLGAVSTLRPGIEVIDLDRPRTARAIVAARLFRLAVRTPADACLVHMNWPMLAAAGPALRARRIRTGLWWAHRAASVELRAAVRYADLVLTSAPGACRVGGRRLRVIGQGIDTARFVPAPNDPAGPFTVLNAGRMAPVKRPNLVSVACRRAGVALRLVGPGTDLPAGHVAEPPVPHTAMPALLQSVHAFATASATGSPDKAALEAMACGLPVVALGEGLRGALPADLAEQVIVPDIDAMAARLRALATMPPASRRAFGLSLREAVVARHALADLAGRIVAAFDTC